MILDLYRLLIFLAAPLLYAYMWFRVLCGEEDSKRFHEKFGYTSKKKPKGKVIWCHAVSVGEAVSVLQIIRKLHERYPKYSFVVTTVTVTAAKMLESKLPPYAIHQYAPLDIGFVIDNFLKKWKPVCAIWTESEIWPNILTTLKSKEISVALVNARMSEPSFQNWSKFKQTAKEVMSCFSICLAQTKADLAKFQKLGLENAKYIGNMKYSSAPLKFNENELARLKKMIEVRRPVWLMASTHRGDEDLAITAHKKLAKFYPEILTIIAPRHPQRGEEIARLSEAEELKVARRSKKEEPLDDVNVYIFDTIGEMGLCYSLSPITVIGGSFSSVGGHNPIEPAQLGSAVIFGPHMQNFAEIEREFVSAGAAVSILPEQLATAIDKSWTGDVLRNKQINSARLLADRKRSIIDNVIHEIESIMFKPEDYEF
ncbi:MAG: 3-deoxy-D-manno-octulosonic acid transferase [Alphaproteobacteria bacterium]|nr:3-deoxy-D-manno-octulosonic acid transferase [Alphaproteobacteria bacterium]MCL2504651.1 3-deoxy-D-manno-octulosonic acid transferase [Alphaproteobacteria bacterium]